MTAGGWLTGAWPALPAATVVGGDKRWSGAELLQKARSIARGERVGWIGHNHPDMLAALFACARAGAALVPLNWRLAEAELRWIAATAGLSRVLRGPGLDAALPGVPAGPPDAADAHPGQADDPLLIVHTSGTTGRPRGAVLTQAAVAANAANAVAIFELTPADRVLTVLPLFHVGGLCIQTLPALSVGATVLLHPRFDADAVFDAVERDRPTLTLLVPAVMAALVAHPRWRGADLASLRAVGAGASAVPPHLIQAFHARGIPVQQVYGATESGPIAIAQTRAEAWAAPGSLGLAAPNGDARIQDAAGRPLPAGTVGEIAVAGRNLMRGYLDDAVATAAVLRDGWLATGDAGWRDGEGRFWFADRLRHVIISGGENIYPAEVERVLHGAPGVVEAAVCGRSDPRWGEVPVAVVVAGPGFDAAAVLAHCAGQLARYKLPAAVVCAPALPRNALGKVELAALRTLANAEQVCGTDHGSSPRGMTAPDHLR